MSTTPSEEQRRAIQRLRSRMAAHLPRLAASSARRAAEGVPRAPSEQLADLKTPRIPNCVGVFGRRGSGKTTVLVETLGADWHPPAGWLVVRPPLDLSTAPAEFPFGLTVLHWLHEAVRDSFPNQAPGHEAESAFQRASKSYFRGAEGFNTLVRDLSLTPEHYATASAREMELRRRLWWDVRAWLDGEACHRGVAGFVVPVDDLDLAAANHHQSLIWSLLDELHQDRLFFVLAADLERVERRLAEEDAFRRGVRGDVDASLSTARDLVYKVLPQVERWELRPWPLGERGSFPPGAPQTISQLVGHLALRPVLAEHLPALLPGWARGLENVHRELEHRVASPEPDASPERDERELFGFLAEASFDFDLARRLRERPLGEWASNWEWVDRGVDTEAGWALALRQLADPQADLLVLLPELSTSPLPLRLESARWVEVLLDVALAEGRVAAERLVALIPVLRARVEQCQATFTRTWQQISDGADDAPACTVAALAWSRWEEVRTPDTPARYVLGLGPALELVTGRVAWPAVFEQQVFRGRDQLLVGVQEPLRTALAEGSGRAAGAEILPARTRRMLRFLDRVGRLPWPALAATDSRIGPLGQARAAASFVYTALRELAITEAGGEWTLADPLRRMAECFTSSPEGLLSIDEARLAELFGNIVSLAEADDALLCPPASVAADGRYPAGVAESASSGPRLSEPDPLRSPAQAALLRFLRSPLFRGLDPRIERARAG